MSDVDSPTAVPAPASVLFPAQEIAKRIEVLGREISQELGGTDRPPILIGVLKGSTFFLADLVRSLSIDVVLDFMSISAYAGGTTPGVVRLVKDLEQSIAGRDVVVVEDIVDTGLTLTYLRKTLVSRRPRSLSVVTLLDKVARRIVPVEVEWRGFTTPDVFVVGYGLDFQGRYRNVPDILAVDDLPRLVNDPLLLVPDLFGKGS